jgi:hypothetical protein
MWTASYTPYYVSCKIQRLAPELLHVTCLYDYSSLQMD